VPFSLLVSQLGYRPEDPKVAVVRGPCPSPDDPGDVAVVDATTGEQVAVVPAVPCGDRWGAEMWTADFSETDRPGRYRLELPDHGIRSSEFAVADEILLTETLRPTSVENLQARIGGKLGWQDCAFDGRGVESHAVVLLGLCDVLTRVPDAEAGLASELHDQLRHGADYLVACVRPDGSVMNEMYIARDRTVWTLAALACLALARTAGIVSSGRYLDAAKQTWEWVGSATPTEQERRTDLEITRQIFGQYPPWEPPAARRGRDLLLMLRAATELYRNTNDLSYARQAEELARTIRVEYQVVQPGEDGLYGHFLAWPGTSLHQRAWEHAGWGYNCGAVLPDDVSGFVALLELFPGGADANLWRTVLHDYAYGYLLPVSQRTPFSIYPLGDFEGELRFFGPSWHGFNGMYGQIARTSMLLGRLFHDQRFERIALANLQWVAGANCGVETGPGRYQGLSWISGLGALSSEAWSGIPGSIGNGFCATPQFQLDHLDDVVDAPRYQTEEDWLVHNGSWLSGLAETSTRPRLKVRTTERGVPVPAEIEVTAGEQRRSLVGNGRGVAVAELPRFAAATVAVIWQGHTIRRSVETISGATHQVLVDFAAALRIDCASSRQVEIHNDGTTPAEAAVRIEDAGYAADSEVVIEPGQAETLPVPDQIPGWYRVVATTAWSQLIGERRGPGPS